MNIAYTVKARQDLRDIYDYIANELLAPETARRMTERIMRDIRTLESMPERNALYQKEPWRSEGLRFLPVKNYLVFYLINGAANTVFIVRIMYGGRYISRQLENADSQEMNL